MMTVAEAIVVEGKYDAIRLHSVVEATVVETDGFRIFKDKAKIALIKRLAEAQGVIILTDSDAAGFVIRDRLCASLPSTQVKHAYIPEITGKEKRKSAPSKEGLLGVEGVDGEIVLEALRRAGATIGDEVSAAIPYLTRLRMYEDGLSGGPDSAALRAALIKKLDLPRYLSTARLMDVLNRLLSEQEYVAALAAVKGETV
jgi:ribonuclease M5